MLIFSPNAAAAPALVKRDPEIRPITAITCKPLDTSSGGICVRCLMSLLGPSGDANSHAVSQHNDGNWTEMLPVGVRLRLPVGV